MMGRLAKRLAVIGLGVLMLIVQLGAAAPPAWAGPARADGPNLLNNPGFESPFGKQCCQADLSKYLPGTPIDEVQVAAGWLGWWLEPDQDPAHPGSCEGRPAPCVAFHRPEWREANCGAVCAGRIRSGGNAQKYFTFYSTHDAGMYQQVSGIAPGTRLRFSVYMQAWSTDSNYGPSAGQGAMGMRVGIDPAGGTNPFSASVIWGSAYDIYDAWGLYTVEATARNSTVTVFTRSTPLYPLQHNDIYLDDASLVVVGAGSAPPTVSPPGADAEPGLVYVVQRGDTLARIARRFGVSLPAIMTANGITNANRILVGQRLVIPGAGGPVNPPLPQSSQTYVVQRGDNLYRIALRFGTTVALIKQLNGLTSDVIRIGQVLLIP